MRAFKSALHLVVATALTAGLVGCGMPGNGAYATYQGSDMSEQESLQIKSFNDGGLLDLLPLEEFEDEDFGLPSEEAETSEADEMIDAAAGTAGKSTTKIGYVRSIEDGKFFLQVSKGVFKKKELTFPLVASNEKMGMKLAKLLNKRVIIRGKTVDKETVTLTRAFQIPSLAIITELLNTGKIKGKIYDARTMQTLDEASITARSLNNGRIYRVTSRRNGSFNLCRLAPGDYTLEVSLAGFARNGVAKITVQKRKSSPQNIALTSGM
ncbi:hypothetical protein D3C87_1028870 [compost metagenome]